ncbi:MAG: nicotinate-nucleotide--dimethylbenzimidazole phosphoribosyltransferase [Ferruginibacter sp.]|nr:nicotinate-nucleotide--dimethylbenzimidazole phosphoribosyltransferase [Cytophagales bacterium]
MKPFHILPPDSAIVATIQQIIDHKTKPPGALGDLEDLALKVATIQQTPSPVLRQPHLVIFAADHGIAGEGVSRYPPEVTRQMVLNFLAGGAAINVFCRQHGIVLRIVDAGVKGSLADHPQLIDAKMADGTQNFAREPAMTVEQCERALERGSEVVDGIVRTGCNVVGFGEMGIGNTSAAAVLMHLFTGQPLAKCVGRGTGLDDQQWARKLSVLGQAVGRYAPSQTPLQTLATFGGFEIVQLCGAMLRAAENRMLILVDGFIASVALLVARQWSPAVVDYCVFCHQSAESGHRGLLDFMGAQPLLRLNLRLGEGTGCALAYPILQSAVLFLREMASFETAGVSQSP